MAIPELFHDPTSPPSRALYWFALEAGLPLHLHYTWLCRGEHRTSAFIRINPRAQLPALRHRDFCISETTAIARYLAEYHGVSGRWFGDTLRIRACVNMRLSWYHTNLHQKADSAAAHAQIEAWLGEARHVAWDDPTFADLLFASELFALDATPGRDELLGPWPRLLAWLDGLRRRAAAREALRA